MNHEIAMLQSLSVCKKYLKKLNDRCVKAALNSFSADDYPNGTLGQVGLVSQLTAERDAFLSVVQTMSQALKQIPGGYRALLVAVYVKNTPRHVIASRYGVSLSTVYRKLAQARKCFQGKMKLLGCDDSWFVENFQNFQCAITMFNQQSHDRCDSRQRA